MKALVVHPGTQHSFALAAQLERLGCLSRFWTGFAYVPDSQLGRGIGYLPPAIKRRVMARSLYGLPEEKLRTRPFIDLRALRLLSTGFDEQTVMFERNLAFQDSIPEVELMDSDVVIGVDTASWLLAERASILSRPFILDRTAGHPLAFEHLLWDLHRRFPQWTGKFQRRLPQLSAAEEIEHQRARWIAVGTSFTRRTLVERGVPTEKIVITALGVDLNLFSSVPRPNASRPVRFVFVGSISAAKGVPLLLEAWRSLGKADAELWLIGSTGTQRKRLIPELPGLRVVGKVQHHELPGMLRQCDVLVLPSYFEGFGAVLLEAMATGLPIIATDSTAAPDLIANGVEGYVIPTGNVEALKTAMARFIDSPDRVALMSRAARRCAERYSWDTYGDRWMSILRNVADAQHALTTTIGTNTRNADTKATHISIRPEKTKVLLVHPGTQYSFQLARQLERHGCLNRFWTGMAYVPATLLGRCIQRLPERVKRQLSNRRLEGVSSERISIRPFGEWQAVQRLRLGHDDQTVMFRRNAAFQTSVPEREFVDSKVVIGFDTSSWLLAERAAALGRRFILDRSIGHPLSFERLVPALRQRFPEWVEDFPPRMPDLLRAEEAEHRLADRIVVPSSFASETLIENHVPAHKITVIPFGVDLSAFRPVPRPDTSRPIRFIFLGALGVRKGLPVLLEAWRSLASLGAELWLVGSVKARHAQLIPALKGLRQIGKVPHEELPALLSQCDVLVFPSYFEGLAQVQLEALAAGLPIIATNASGATDLIADSREGYIIPVGDAEALREAMFSFIKSPADLAIMSPAARLCAERYSWEAYGDRWMNLLDQVVHSDTTSMAWSCA
jgi:starch synthase